MDSILLTIKKLLGVSSDYTHFDIDIITDINTVFPILRELGIESEEAFAIDGPDQLWDDYIITNNISSIKKDELKSIIKTYVYLKVKLLFDPSSSGILTDTINKAINELEWRITSIIECGNH